MTKITAKIGTTIVAVTTTTAKTGANSTIPARMTTGQTITSTIATAGTSQIKFLQK